MSKISQIYNKKNPKNPKFFGKNYERNKLLVHLKVISTMMNNWGAGGGGGIGRNQLTTKLLCTHLFV
jgi:hypothetical protein